MLPFITIMIFTVHQAIKPLKLTKNRSCNLTKMLQGCNIYAIFVRMDITLQIIEARKRANITAQDMAKYIGVSRQKYTKIEQGKAGITLAQLNLILVKVNSFALILPLDILNLSPANVPPLSQSKFKPKK